MSKSRKFINFLLIVVMAGLTGYAIWLSQRIYEESQATSQEMLSMSENQSALATRFAGMYRTTQDKLTATQEELASTKKLYEESELALSSVTQDLEMTKKIIAQTHALLKELKAGKMNPKTVDLSSLENIEFNKFSRKENQLQDSLVSLQNENQSLTSEIETLKNELNRYQGDAANLNEARGMIALLKERIHEVKLKIRDFKSEAVNTRIVALRERDRVRTMLGNNGYMTKEGQLVSVDLAKYNAANPNEMDEAQAAKASRKVGINVTFFK